MSYSSHSPVDGLPPEQTGAPKSIAIPSKRNNPSITPCGCRCGGCSCSGCFTNGRVSFLDSTYEAYRGPGTKNNSLSNKLVNLNASSLEAEGPKNTIVAPPSLELLSKLNEYTPAQLAETRTEKYLDNVDEAPWRHFVERSMTSDATETSGLFFGDIDVESSMENNPVSRDSHSMLSSYMSVMSIRDDASSAVVSHAGAGHHATPQPANNQRRPWLTLL